MVDLSNDMQGQRQLRNCCGTAVQPINDLFEVLCEMTGWRHRVSPCQPIMLVLDYPLCASEDVGEKQLYYSRNRDGI